ncbi:unnamed protein product [Medioppia subpectinata]|uniref:Uncharacterized protein n=1 Tax=Medioppia subpectinata TaxID=1979941 RepID=A0A7R9Q493_9ACAR|nr:unnamed protein product [Medioppia subpectinata]CAG2112068.1 unnamed protein product [Medioppia subpectinata]
MGKQYVVITFRTHFPKFAKLSCIENDCDIRSEQSVKNKDKIESQEDLPLIELMPTNSQIKLIGQLSEFPFEPRFLANTPLKTNSEMSDNSLSLLPMIEKMSKNTKQNWIQRLRDFKRTEGNRNFQTQGWK